MKTPYILITTLIISVLFISTGCSSKSNSNIPSAKPESEKPKTTQQAPSQVEFTEDEINILNALGQDELFSFLGKTFDKDFAVERWNNEYKNRKQTSSPPPGYDIQDDITRSILFPLLCEILYNKPAYLDSPTSNYNSWIEQGALAIIPRNPYTDEDIKTSLEYSPGDLLIACNRQGFILLFHSGISDVGYEPDKDNHDVLFYPIFCSMNDNGLTDGRTVFEFYKYNDGKFDQISSDWSRIREQFYGSFHPIEYTKIYWLHFQVRKFMTAYAQLFENVPDTFDGYINLFGRKNPNAWINPYSGAPMNQVGFPDCVYGPTPDMKNPTPPVPISMIEKGHDIYEYAGNYSYAVFEDEKSSIAVFSIYYLDENNKLRALSVRRTPKTRFHEELWGTH